MNRTAYLSTPSKLLFRLAMKFRKLQKKKRSHAFGALTIKEQPRIERIYVINLNRQPTRLSAMERELRHVLDSTGTELWNLTERYDAIDGTSFIQDPLKNADLDPIYTLADQLFVEPQPLVLPTKVELDAPIQMSRPEIAVARSHINIWRKIIASDYKYVLVLEDDVWFRRGFAKNLDRAWEELKVEKNDKNNFDIFYLSYKEVKHGAPKTLLSSNTFRPERGLWYLSGYVLSRKGAKKLLNFLPCRGPVDLWINHKFGLLDVRAIRKPIINQRSDIFSTNSYSILPALTKIGAINSESTSLFHIRPNHRPVFAFGSADSGLSSLAMALSILGYRCCSDLQTLPASELEMVLRGNTNRIFDAYVNIRTLETEILALKKNYPQAKFILTTRNSKAKDANDLQIINDLEGVDFAILNKDGSNKWQIVCEHLRCAPPSCSFPELADLGQRQVLDPTIETNIRFTAKTPKRDKSPWLVESNKSWQGIHFVPIKTQLCKDVIPVKVSDSLKCLDIQQWCSRNDTFTGNLGLFRSSNIEFDSDFGAAFSIKKESLGVREYSAASLTSNNQYLFGRFEAVFKASNVPGVVTGFFLHRDSPRQEIDIEIAGNRTDRLLINVFYNPGEQGAKFDYGYRGAPTYIDLGFDASKSYHKFSIEWEPSEIRWFVDSQLVHRRVEWNPTPIPHLPMFLHVNIWPSGSKELAGRINNSQLPATTFVKSIVLEANQCKNPKMR